ncbi:MAG: hypothetical protein J5896_05965 [Alphaproteobacteria bacterium]|nr:hypothetical protein [Alphaproteobacteria bacterium]
MCYGISEKAIVEQRDALKQIKEDLQRLLKPQKIVNVGDVFILSDTYMEDGFDANVIVAHLTGLPARAAVNFSALALKQALFAGETKYAMALKVSFGGELKQTGSTHCVEWLWKGDRELKIDEAIRALFNVV